MKVEFIFKISQRNKNFIPIDPVFSRWVHIIKKSANPKLIYKFKELKWHLFFSLEFESFNLFSLEFESFPIFGWLCFNVLKFCNIPKLFTFYS